jgi:hypothetical protein
MVGAANLPVVDVRSETWLLDPRAINQALADLRKKYAEGPDPDLARMIRQLQAEIAIRKRPCGVIENDQNG